MMIRNGVRATASNFVLVWKYLVYLCVTVAICYFALKLSIQPILTLLKNTGWIDECGDFFATFYVDPSCVAEGFKDLSTNLYKILSYNLNATWGSYLAVILVVGILPNILFNIGEYSLGKVVGERMSSLYNRSYLYAIVTNLGRSSLYSLWKLLISLPFGIITICAGYVYGILVNNTLSATLMLPLLIIVVFFIYSMRYVLLIGFLPTSTLEGGNIVSNFVSGLKNYSKNFMVKVLYIFGVFVCELGIILLSLVFTVGVGLIVSIPACCLLNIVIMYSNYFTIKGQKFYISEGAIIKPMEREEKD